MELDTALKEWSIVCDFLAQGKSCLLLRKGGVHEYAGPGRFELAYERFLMFPAWEHERLDWIKPDWLPPEVRDEMDTGTADASAAPSGGITFRGYGEIAGIWSVPSRAAFDSLDDLHGWLAPQIDMRFNYKPDRPLYLIAVRAFRLPVPATIPNREAFAGCMSWVPLAPGDEVDVRGAQRAIPEGAFESILDRIDQAMSGGG